MRYFSRNFMLSLGFSISVILSLVYYVVFYIPPELISYSDTTSFITGSLQIRGNLNENYYDGATQQRIQEEYVEHYRKNSALLNKTLPFVGLLFLPLSYLTFTTSYKIFGLLNILFLITLTSLSYYAFTRIKNKGLIILLPFISISAIHTILIGQLSIIISLILLLIYILYKENRKIPKTIIANRTKLIAILAGLLSIKLQFIIFIPYLFLLIKRKKEFLTYLLSFVIVLVLLNIYLTGPGAYQNYFSFLLSGNIGLNNGDTQRMMSLTSTLQYLPYFANNKLVLLTLNFISYLFSSFYFYKRTHNTPKDILFAVAIVWTLLFGIHMLEYEMTTLLISIFILLNSIKDIKSKVAIKLIIILLFLMPIVVLKYPTIVTILAIGVTILILNRFTLIKEINF